MISLWEQGGSLVSSAEGDALIECEDCPCGSVSEACSGDIPDQFKVVLDGLENAACVGCEVALNATYFCSHVGACSWLRTGLLACGAFVQVMLESDGGSGYLVRVTLNTTTDGAGAIEWRKHYDSKPDCMAFDNVDIPYHSDNSPACNGASSTCTLSTL